MAAVTICSCFEAPQKYGLSLWEPHEQYEKALLLAAYIYL